jgi:hypothetical protein
MNEHTIESYLELLTGYTTADTYQLDPKDTSILQSLVRQIHKGVALTDRQYMLLKEKLLTYKEQFEAHGHTTLDLALENLRIPLRTIDRTKLITLVEDIDRKKPFNTIDTKKIPWIKIRFPFAKKTIVLIEEISAGAGADYYHEKGSHEHYFRSTERNIFKVVEQFKDKNFDIDPQLLEHHKKLEVMNNNKENYIPGIYNFKLKNLDKRSVDYMISSVGEPTKDNLAIYVDRKEQYGLRHFDQTDVELSLSSVTHLAKKIALRTKFQVFISNKKYNVNQLVEAILDLYRFPLLVILPTGNQLTQLHKIHSSFNGVIHPELSSVVFRMDNNDEGKEFNNYIKQNNLNNIVDSKTKIVYTDTTKLPKPLIKLNWRPSAVLLLDSFRPNGKVLNFIESSDLIIHYDETPSRFMIRDMDIIE